MQFKDSYLRLHHIIGEKKIKQHIFCLLQHCYPTIKVINSPQGTRAIVDNVLDAQSVIPYQASYNNVQQCVEALVDSEGVPSFWKGCSALLLQYSTRFAVVHTVRILLKYINNFSDKPSLVPNDSATSLEK